MDLSLPITNVAPLLPHSGKMVLLDSVTEYSEQHVCATASVLDGHILLQGDAIPCFAAIEILAQGIGAYAGITALRAGEAVKLGFLLGTRKLQLFTERIPIGTKLHVRADVSVFDATGMGVFDCELRTLPENELLVKAALNVYSPKTIIKS